MRIQVLSDLHNEFDRFEPPRVDADLVVLAGDTDRGLRGLEWAVEVFSPTPVLYVSGNHEFYGFKLPRLHEKLQARALELGAHYLERNAVVLDGVRFLGCTLWTDLGLHGDPNGAAQVVLDTMNDCRRIRVPPTYRRFRPSDYQVQHTLSLRWLQEALLDQTLPTVVITHHAPSALGLRPEDRERAISAAYASNLDAMVAASGARLWIHGHTHHHVDTEVGSVRMLSNPRGYVPDDPADDFDPALVVEV